jgi:hypothetical protein
MHEMNNIIIIIIIFIISWFFEYLTANFLATMRFVTCGTVTRAHDCNLIGVYQEDIINKFFSLTVSVSKQQNYANCTYPLRPTNLHFSRTTLL